MLKEAYGITYMVIFILLVFFKNKLIHNEMIWITFGWLPVLYIMGQVFDGLHIKITKSDFVLYSYICGF